jgi:integral membrane protein (TIGR01906 family)
MPEATRPGERLEAVAAAICMAVAVLGLTLLPLTSPLYVRVLVSAVHAEELTGIGRDATLKAAENVRRFVLDEDAEPLPESIAGVPAFDQSASSHLVDVRRVLLPARSLTLVLAAASAAWLLLRGKHHPMLRRMALRLAAYLLAGSVALAALVGTLDFDSFFTWFHGLFFEPGTWVFPYDALLIRIFPLPFWMSAAATWAALVLVAAFVMFICARRSHFTRTNYGV